MEKIVVSGNRFSFKLPEEYAKAHGIGIHSNTIAIRMDPDLIAIVEADTYKGDLVTIKIPNNYTDIGIIRRNGLEDIIAIVDDKLVYVREEEEKIVDIPLEQLFIN